MTERTILVGTNVQREELNNTLLDLAPMCHGDLREAAKFGIGIKDLKSAPAHPCLHIYCVSRLAAC